MATNGLLAGRVAVVTGSGRNIGKGISKTFADHGASVVVNDVDEERAMATKNELRNTDDQRHQVVVGDVTDDSSVSEMRSTIENEYDSLDILVNNVGYAVNKSVFDTTASEWDQVIDLTLKSTFLCSKHLGEVIADSNGGSIINLASRLGHTGTSEKTAYCAAKGGVVNMTRQLAIDFAEHDVRVNSISPGLIGDPVGHDTGKEDRDRTGVPLGRIGTPNDVGNAALYLASDLSEYVTGADLAVDGGRGT